MSSHFQIHCLAAQNVEMQVRNGLAGISTAVGDHTVTVCKAFGLGNLRDHLENMGDDSAVFSGDIIGVGHMGLGDHQHMGGCLGSDVPESQNGILLIGLGRGDGTCNDLTEQTITHNQYLQLIKYQQYEIHCRWQPP